MQGIERVSPPSYLQRLREALRASCELIVIGGIGWHVEISIAVPARIGVLRGSRWCILHARRSNIRKRTVPQPIIETARDRIVAIR